MFKILIKLIVGPVNVAICQNSDGYITRILERPVIDLLLV